MNKLTKGALLSVSILVVSAGAIASNIPAIAATYPEVPNTIIELLTTIPSLFLIMTVLISHKVAHKIGYTRTVQLGISMVIVAGLLPAFTESFAVLFFSRMLFGFGVGLFNPLLYSIASKFYKGRELATLIGLQSSFEGIGGMLVTFLVGQLLMISWRVSFLAYGIAIPVLLLFFFFVPKIGTEVEYVKKNKKKEKIDSVVWRYIILLIVVVTVYMSMSVKITTVILDKGIGTATDGSNFLALVGLGAMLAGIIFGRMVDVMKQWTLSFAFGGMGLAMFIIAFANNLLLILAAAVLAGLAFRTFIPYVFNEINQKSTNAEKNTSVLLIAFNIGSAFTPVTLGLFQGLIPNLNNINLLIAQGVLMLVLALGTGIAMNLKTVQVEGSK